MHPLYKISKHGMREVNIIQSIKNIKGEIKIINRNC